MKPPCIWHEDSEGNWETDCGNMFVLNEGSPKHNKMKFCCFCGMKLAERKWKEPEP